MQAESNRVDWLTIGQLAVGVVGCLVSFLLAGLLFFIGGQAMLTPGTPAAEYVVFFLLAGLAAGVGVLNIPSVVLAVRALGGKSAGLKLRFSAYRLASFAILTVPLILLLGHFVSQSSFAWLVLPFLNFLALLFPVWWIIEFGRRSLPSGTPQRSWGLVSVSLSITPFVVILVEMFFLILVVLAVLLVLGAQPAWMELFNQLLIQFNQSEIDPTFAQTLLTSALESPLVIMALFFTVGVLMPLIEELLKPLGLWMLRKKVLSPAEGFSAGLICGAGFALMESAVLVAQSGGEAWAQMVMLRVATSILHITASGLVGWGLACAWQQKKAKNFLLALLAATVVHGLWNSLAILSALLPFLSGASLPTAMNTLPSGAIMLLLTLLLVGLSALLFRTNRRLQAESNKADTPLQAPPPQV